MIRENQNLLNRLNLLCDGLLLAAAMMLSYFIRFFLFQTDATYLKIENYLLFLAVLLPLYYFVFSSFDLITVFRHDSFHRETAKLMRASAVMAGIIAVLLFVFKLGGVSRWVMVQYFFISTALLFCKRWIVRKITRRMRGQGHHKKTLILLGSGATAQDCLRVVQNKQDYGYEYLGYVANHAQMEGEYLGDFGALYDILNKYKPEELICALELEEGGQLGQIMEECEKTGTKVSIVPFCYRYIPTRPYIDQMDSIPLINTRRVALDNFLNAFIKRAIDIVVSVVALLVLSPVFLLTAVLVKLTSPGPVIFKQQRVGKNKALFTMYKFRSMVLNDESDTAWSTDADPRKTAFGSFIRKFSIDELPQLVNVLKGDMSLVGPRPELPHYVQHFQKEIAHYMVKHQVKPGITGLAQVKGFRGDTSIPKRIEWDIYYIENWSVMLDVKILLQTAFRAFKNDEKILVTGEGENEFTRE